MTFGSRAKGKGGELEVSKILTARGFSARRGQQFHGGPGSPDVICITDPPTHLEVKRTEALSLYKAYDQAVRDARPGRTPVVVHRRSHKPWLAILKFDDFLGLLK